MFKYIFSVIFLYFFFGFLLYFFQRKIIFNVSGPPQKPIFYGLINTKEMKIITDDLISLLCWYSYAHKNKPTLIYFHGNSFDIGERSYRVKRYIDHGWGVLLVSWRGYSGNNGKPSEKNLYIDAESIS